MGRRRITVADIKEVLVAWDAGESVSGIARMFGYTRPTVRKYVHAAEYVGLTRGEAEWERLTRAAMDRVARRRARGPAATEVAEHRDYLDKQVGTVHLSVLYQRLRDERGLRASWRTFHRYVRAQWPERMRGAPAATVRLDDPPPGEEAQVDFFYVGLGHDPGLGRRRKLYAFLMTLSHSRHQFLYPVLAEDATAWHEGHVKGLAFFGGAPRRVVPDNLTAGIRKADRYDPRINRAYGELARHYGFLVDPARAAHPTDKPKVERGVSYARASFFAGRDFASLEGMRAAALQWCLTTAGLRAHGTTGEQPLVVFQKRERAALRPLPTQPWEPVTWTTAKVQADCHVRADNVLYSVPYRYVGQRLDVRLGARTVTIHEGEAVAEHKVTRVLLQQDREVAQVYQADGTPSAVVVRPDGSIGSPLALGAEAIRALVARTVMLPVPVTMRQSAAGNGQGLAAAPGLPPGPKIGEPAPALVLPDLAGHTIDLATFRGHKTLVLFWSPECGFCQQMLDDLKAWETNPSPGAPQLLVVSRGTVEANQAQGLRSPVVLDEGFAAARAFGATGTPMAVLVEAYGTIASEVVAGAAAVLALARGERVQPPAAPAPV